MRSIFLLRALPALPAESDAVTRIQRKNHFVNIIVVKDGYLSTRK